MMNRNRPSRRMFRRAAIMAVAMSVGAAPAAFAADPGQGSAQAAAPATANTPATGSTLRGRSGPPISDPNYQLGPGDNLRVLVFGQPDLSGEFHVDGAGNVALPLIGNIAAGGISAGQLEKRISAALSPDYLRDPRVSVEVLTYRPFYIVGEVKNPGNYPYTNGMTVINAVAMAGGFTYRARDDDFTITRANDPTKSQQDADQNTKVNPGDVITVPERWF